MIKVHGLIGAAAAALMAFQAPALAQDYPTDSVRLVVPYAAGGTSDGLARLLADRLTKLTGETFYIENMPGAAGSIGAAHVKNSPADGYTFLLAAASFVTTVVTMSDPGYAVEDFIPIALIGTDANVLLTTSDIATNMEEFLAYAKENSGDMFYASLGLLSVHDMLSTKMADIAGFEWTSVPFAGDAPALTALLSGEVQAYFGGLDTAVPLEAQPADGSQLPDLVLLGYAAPSRSVFKPDLPTLDESGFPGVYEETWTALFVHKDTPPEIVEKLRADVQTVLKSQEMVDAISAMRVEPFDGTMEEFQEMMEGRAQRFRDYMERFNIDPT